jgi:hypothetical protein
MNRSYLGIYKSSTINKIISLSLVFPVFFLFFKSIIYFLVS